MKNNRLSIGQMAELNHTTLATLRLYDENGLLKPVNVASKWTSFISQMRCTIVVETIVLSR